MLAVGHALGVAGLRLDLLPEAGDYGLELRHTRLGRRVRLGRESGSLWCCAPARLWRPLPRRLLLAGAVLEDEQSVQPFSSLPVHVLPILRAVLQVDAVFPILALVPGVDGFAPGHRKLEFLGEPLQAPLLARHHDVGSYALRRPLEPRADAPDLLVGLDGPHDLVVGGRVRELGRDPHARRAVPPGVPWLRTHCRAAHQGLPPEGARAARGRRAAARAARSPAADGVEVLAGRGNERERRNRACEGCRSRELKKSRSITPRIRARRTPF